MKKIILAIAVTISVPAIPFPVSSAVKTVEEPAGDAKQKEEYEKSMEERLGKLGKEMDELKAKAGTMAGQARSEANRYIADAERKRKAASRKLDEMKVESKKKWKKFSSEVSAAMDEFEKAYEKAKSHFKQ